VNGRANSFEMVTPFESTYDENEVPVRLEPAWDEMDGTTNSFESGLPLELIYDESAAVTKSPDNGFPFESTYADSAVPVVPFPVRVDTDGTLNSFESGMPLESTYDESAAVTKSLDNGFPFESTYADSAVPVVPFPARADIDGTLNSFESGMPLESMYEGASAYTAQTSRAKHTQTNPIILALLNATMFYFLLLRATGFFPRSQIVVYSASC